MSFVNQVVVIAKSIVLKCAKVPASLRLSGNPHVISMMISNSAKRVMDRKAPNTALKGDSITALINFVRRLDLNKIKMKRWGKRGLKKNLFLLNLVICWANLIITATIRPDVKVAEATHESSKEQGC